MILAGGMIVKSISLLQIKEKEHTQCGSISGQTVVKTWYLPLLLEMNQEESKEPTQNKLRMKYVHIFTLFTDINFLKSS